VFTSSAGTSPASTSSASASSTAFPNQNPKPSNSKGHAVPIAGGVAGGVILIGVAAIFYLRWRKQSLSKAGGDASDAYNGMRPDRTVASEALMLTTEDETEVGVARRVAGSSLLSPLRLLSTATPQQSPVTRPQPRFYVRDFMSHATMMCPHASFSYSFHTPRAQTTLLRPRYYTKAIRDIRVRTILQLLN